MCLISRELAAVPVTVMVLAATARRRHRIVPSSKSKYLLKYLSTSPRGSPKRQSSYHFHPKPPSHTLFRRVGLTFGL